MSEAGKGVSVEADGAGWVVRVDLGSGKPQAFHCASEAMARQMAASFSRKVAPRPAQPS